jgi:hypothetical protein
MGSFRIRKLPFEIAMVISPMWVASENPAQQLSGWRQELNPPLDPTIVECHDEARP